jgi:methylated-DNA-protein-cysteine methyltransferase-like protein
MAKNKSDFFEQVYQVVRLIPKGKVSSYGAIAKYLGGSPRVVGYAMNAAHQASPKVPAQRVVNRLGMLTGKMHFTTPHEMEELLLKDGVKVKDDCVINFSAVFWDPETELKL